MALEFAKAQVSAASGVPPPSNFGLEGPGDILAHYPGWNTSH